MKKVFLIVIFLLLFCFSVFAQNENSPCPTIVVAGPESVIREGEVMSFSVSAGIENKLEKAEFKWSVDKGKIIKGQYTSKIEVNTSGLYDTVITATLEIIHLPSGCKREFSETGVVAGGHPIPLDEYGDLSLKDELTRIDNFLVELAVNLEDQGYIIFSYKEKEHLQKIKNRVRRLIKHLKYRGFPVERITFLIDKEINKNRTVLRRVSKNADFTQCENCEVIKGSDLK